MSLRDGMYIAHYEDALYWVECFGHTINDPQIKAVVEHLTDSAERIKDELETLRDCNEDLRSDNTHITKKLRELLKKLPDPHPWLPEELESELREIL